MVTETYFGVPPEGMDLMESRTASNNAIGIVLLVAAIIAVILRTIARLGFQNVSLAADDYFMYAGLLLCFGNLACCIAGGYHGLGKHIWSLGPEDMEKISIITFAYVYIYAWSVSVIKISILLLYRRIFGMTWLAWWCVFLTTGYLITNHVVLPLYCKPLSFYWSQFYQGSSGYCPVDEAKFYLGVGIINMFGDLCILAVPVPAVWHLQMPRAQKVAISFIFLLGGFVCIASIIRIKVIVDLTKTEDISWAKSDVFIWSSVEPSVGIISGCLPTLRALLIWTLNQFGLTGILGSSNRFLGGYGVETSHGMDGHKDGGTGENSGDGSQQKGSKPKRRRPNNYTSIINSIAGTGLRPDDEMCLTTVTASKAGESTSSIQNSETQKPDSKRPEPNDIVVREQFQWSESKGNEGNK